MIAYFSPFFFCHRIQAILITGILLSTSFTATLAMKDGEEDEEQGGTKESAKMQLILPKKNVEDKGSSEERILTQPIPITFQEISTLQEDMEREQTALQYTLGKHHNEGEEVDQSKKGPLKYDQETTNQGNANVAKPFWEAHYQDERDLLQKLSSYLCERLKDRLLAYYVIGSLTHDGYVRDFSDIDIAIILDSLHEEDENFLQKLAYDIHKLDWKLANRLSLFWGSIDSINKGTGGKFYIPDVIDLIENGILIYGQDIRNRFAGYRRDQLINSVIAYFLQKFPVQTVLEELQSAEFTFKKKAHIQYIRRICHQILLPLRFMYTLETGLLGFNHVVADYYLDKFDNNSAPSWLIKEIYLCRNNKDITEDLEHNVLKYKTGLSQIYIELINLCLRSLDKTKNPEEMSHQLQRYKSILEKSF
jgi:hypothetical protein